VKFQLLATVRIFFGLYRDRKVADLDPGHCEQGGCWQTGRAIDPQTHNL
jgi:hypothetical protein